MYNRNSNSSLATDKLRLDRATHVSALGKCFTFLLVILCGGVQSVLAADDLLSKAEAARIDLIKRMSPAVVCVFDESQRGGGSGVIIDPAGYGLTNFHVVAGMMEKRRGFGGLSDGKLYELSVLGVDPTGDVAMFKLQRDEPFAFAKLGDSDSVRVGDSAIAMGNPFVLSEDYTPSVTLGIVTGVHRYQWGEGSELVYSDCIQVDTSINPGNSGGPLFNLSGEVIGINGRISVNTRGRFNVGFGYAIGMNQIKRFIPGLRAGLLTNHGTLQATVERTPEGLVFGTVRPGASADKSGVRTGDVLLALDGKKIETPNEFASQLGTYPADWSLPLRVRRDDKELEFAAKLDSIAVKLEKKFTADAALAQEAMKYVLGRFQRGVFTEKLSKRPSQWKWSVASSLIKGVGAIRDWMRLYECTLQGDEPIVQVERWGDGEVVAKIEYSDKFAKEENPGLALEGLALHVSADRAMVLHAIYVLHRWMLAPVDSLPSDLFSHGGGQMWYTGSATEAGKNDGAQSGHLQAGRVVEVIKCPLADFAEGRFCFDIETGRLIGIEVIDKPMAETTRIDIGKYEDIGGLVWPTEIMIRERNHVTRETWTGWELKP